MGRRAPTSSSRTLGRVKIREHTRQLMRSAGVTLAEAGRVMEPDRPLSESMVSKLLSNDPARPLSYERLVRLADRLRVPAELIAVVDAPACPRCGFDLAGLPEVA